MSIFKVGRVPSLFIDVLKDGNILQEFVVVSSNLLRVFLDSMGNSLLDTALKFY
jgi:hypothetical protein